MAVRTALAYKKVLFTIAGLRQGRCRSCLSPIRFDRWSRCCRSFLFSICFCGPAWFAYRPGFHRPNPWRPNRRNLPAATGPSTGRSTRFARSCRYPIPSLVRSVHSIPIRAAARLRASGPIRAFGPRLPAATSPPPVLVSSLPSSCICSLGSGPVCRNYSALLTRTLFHANRSSTMLVYVTEQRTMAECKIVS